MTDAAKLLLDQHSANARESIPSSEGTVDLAMLGTSSLLKGSVPVLPQEATPSPLLAPKSVPGLLTQAKCREYISMVESRPWRGNAVVANGKSTRTVTNSEIEIDVNNLLDSIRAHVPEKLCGLSLMSIPAERVLFVRYGPGEYFDLHTDGAYRPSTNRRSLFSMLVYLNDDFIGGETHFPDLQVTVKPETGTGLIIPHGVFHQGLKITGGIKYAFHSYILYACSSAPQSS
jgi:prolyl 4-hydroxylase